MNYQETLEELEKTLVELREENKIIPIIVEGDKDTEALRKLGVTGEIISLNKGMSLTDFCDWIAQTYGDIILLTDWDRKGGRLFFLLKKNLESRVKCNTSYRKVFAKRCICRTVEGLPSWLQTLQGKIENTKPRSFTPVS